MGAWGAGAFENEAALDWVSEFEEWQDLSMIGEVLGKVLKSKVVDSQDAEKALAAVEVIAYLKKRPIDQGFPDELATILDDIRTPVSERQLKDAMAAVEKIFSGPSLLKDLWEDSDEFDEWMDVKKDLLARLNC